MLQNATPLRKSLPWSPNTSTSCVSCTAPATRNASLQILFKCPTPAIVFGNATKPSRFAHFWQVHNPLRLPREATSEPPKVVRTPGVFNILTSKCASRHNGMHLFNISTSKSVLNVVCFVHSDLEMCFAPQRRALFQHLNFQKCSEREVFLAFSLANVLRATTACTFSTSQLPKVIRPWCVLYISTWKCASRHNGVQFFISHLARWLRTRRFSEPTFSRTWIFFLLRLSLCWSSFFFSSLLWLFPSSKLPSIYNIYRESPCFNRHWWFNHHSMVDNLSLLSTLHSR